MADCVVYMHDMIRSSEPLPSVDQVLGTCICLKVRMASRAVTKAYDEALRPTGIRITQLTVLVALANDGAQSITSIANVLGMDRSTLKRTIAPLEDEGLVVVGGEGWRRSRMLELTHAGRERLREALPFWQRAQRALNKKLGQADWTRVQTVLARLTVAA